MKSFKLDGLYDGQKWLLLIIIINYGWIHMFNMYECIMFGSVFAGETFCCLNAAALHKALLSAANEIVLGLYAKWP